jgi:hypothetical protein
LIILDTNVLSEILTPRPARQVLDWPVNQPPQLVFTTAVTEAEIRYGFSILPEGRRRRELQAAILPIFEEEFARRVLPFDTKAAELYADIAAKRRASGRPISQFDAQIAAIARLHGAQLATKNIGDFVDTGIEIINPWDFDP